jgi:hypothetical protein
MRDPVRLGFNPFNHFSFDPVFKDGGLRDHFFERSSRIALFGALRSVATDYYRHLAADQNKYAACWFAEKCEAQGIEYGTRASDMALFPEGREILLIRDPRDILCSSLSYFRQPFSENWLKNLQNGCETIRQIVSKKSKGTLVVKYEALVFDQLATLKTIARFLGIADAVWSDEPILDAKLFKKHATTESPQESVGRWKENLSDSQMGTCAKAFGTFLSEFGYS